MCVQYVQLLRLGAKIYSTIINKQTNNVTTWHQWPIFSGKPKSCCYRWSHGTSDLTMNEKWETPVVNHTKFCPRRSPPSEEKSTSAMSVMVTVWLGRSNSVASTKCSTSGTVNTRCWFILVFIISRVYMNMFPWLLRVYIDVSLMSQSAIYKLYHS